MILHSFIVNILIYVLLGFGDEPYYKSESLKDLNLRPIVGEYHILDDQGEIVTISAFQDEKGILYWYRKIQTPVCLTGECKLVNVGLYWYPTGSFMGLEVYREHLTKTDHSLFSKEDYDKLIAVLSNEWSGLREYEFSDLIDEGAEGVDGTSGATKKEIASEAVDDAVYTTFTLWHLANSGEKDQLIKLTANMLKDRKFFDAFIQGKNHYRLFLLDLLGQGKMEYSDHFTGLLLEGLKSKNDPSFRNSAIKSLTRIDLNSRLIQTELAGIYPHAPLNEKLQILSALEGVSHLDNGLYQALSNDLSAGNEWFSIKILKVIKLAPDHSPEVMAAAKNFINSDNSLLRETSINFLKPNQSKK